MKILSIYLPAFHEVEINNKTWGKGFTEWDNVKSGNKYFKNHYQPLVPLNHNYYDLSKKDDIIWQIKIANKYGVDGFIFYHYWFDTYDMELEKPAEILKNSINEDIEYCFCWANQSWFTTWHGMTSNIIKEQVYGERKDWKIHFNYLLGFFKDKRYIKIDNKPVIYIYNMSDIDCREEMFHYWDELAIKKGFSGIYIIEYISSKNKKDNYSKTSAVVEFEPLYTTFFDISKFNLLKRFICKKLKQIDYQDYNKLWKYIINRKRTYNSKIIQKGCFVGWDNSARKGRDSMVVKNNTSFNFQSNLEKLINNNRKDSTNDFIVINAWNEWSEGAMLEPTEKDKYSYLEVIKKVKDNYEK